MGPQAARPILRFAKLTDKAFAPTKGSVFAAGYDLYAAYDAVVPPKGKTVVKTDIQVAVPSGCYGRVAPRSGLTVKNFIDVGGKQDRIYSCRFIFHLNKFVEKIDIMKYLLVVVSNYEMNLRINQSRVEMVNRTYI